MLKIRQPISLHPRLVAVFDALFALLLLWWLAKLDQPWMLYAWFGFRAAWWGGLLPLMYCPPAQSRWRHWLALVFFNLGLTTFLVFIDWHSAWLVSAALFIGMPLISFWLAAGKGSDLSFLSKPLRRWQFLMSVAGLNGLWTGVAAAGVLQAVSRTIFWILLAGASLLTAAASVWWWREYGVEQKRRLPLYSLMVFVIMSEAAFALSWWPWGFLASGFLLTWGWYVLWLLLRFHLSAAGINWRKQVPFLGVNFALMALYIFFIARWK